MWCFDNDKMNLLFYVRFEVGIWWVRVVWSWSLWDIKGLFVILFFRFINLKIIRCKDIDYFDEIRIIGGE